MMQNLLPMNKICWPPILSNESYIDSLGVDKQLEVDVCSLPMYIAEYFQHVSFVYILRSL